MLGAGGGQHEPGEGHEEPRFNETESPLGSPINDESDPPGDATTPLATDPGQAISGTAPTGASPFGPIMGAGEPIPSSPHTDSGMASVLSAPTGSLDATDASSEIGRIKRHWPWITATGVLLILLVTAAVLGLNQRNSARNWSRLDHIEVSKFNAATAAYRAETHKYQSTYAALTSTQNQLSAVTTQKEKALDQNAVLQKVASDLNQCVNDAQQVFADIDTSLNTGSVPYSAQADADTMVSACQSAQSEESNVASGG